jgi:hypothetical protein
MSAGYKLLDFSDLYTAVLEELKIPSTDGTTLGRIKRDLNMIYLNHVIPFKPRAWEWMSQNEEITTYEKIDTGTISVTADSVTITFSDAPTNSLTGYYVKLQGYPDIVKVSAHTALSTTATIEKAWCNTTVADVSFKAWRDFSPLSSTMKQIIQVTHDRKGTPLDAVNGTKFTEMRARYPEYEGFPVLYNMGDFDSDGNRLVKWFPACFDDRVTLHIEGRQEATALSADGDEPLMPVEDRIVLFYGACSRAWARERNESEASKNWNLFMQKLVEMAGRAGDAPQITEMSTDHDYLLRKRYKRYGRSGRRFEND